MQTCLFLYNIRFANKALICTISKPFFSDAKIAQSNTEMEFFILKSLDVFTAKNGRKTI